MVILDSSGDGDGHGFRGRKPVSMSINKWAKPIPKLELPPTCSKGSSSEGEQDQDDLGIVVHECGISYVYLE